MMKKIMIPRCERSIMQMQMKLRRHARNWAIMLPVCEEACPRCGATPFCGVCDECGFPVI